MNLRQNLFSLFTRTLGAALLLAAYSAGKPDHHELVKEALDNKPASAAENSIAQYCERSCAM